MTNQSLQRWYGRVNREVCGGKLPSARVRFGMVPDDSMAATTLDKEKFVILLDYKLRGYPAVCSWLLLHEIVHVERWPDLKCEVAEFSDRVYELMRGMGKFL